MQARNATPALRILLLVGSQVCERTASWSEVRAGGGAGQAAWSAPGAAFSSAPCPLCHVPVQLCVEGGIRTDTVPAPKEPTVWGMMLEPKEGWPMVGLSKGHWGSFQDDMIIR